MEDRKKLVELLKKKYGITTMSQLNEALAEQRTIDLSPFVTYDGLGIKENQRR